MVKLPEMPKPDTCPEATDTSKGGTGRGDWGKRASREIPEHRETLSGARVAKDASGGQGGGKSIIRPLSGRESEQPIVALKRGNSRGAKGLYFSRVSSNKGRAA